MYREVSVYVRCGASGAIGVPTRGKSSSSAASFDVRHTAVMSLQWTVALALAFVLIAIGAALLVFVLMGRFGGQVPPVRPSRLIGRLATILATIVAFTALAAGSYAALVKENDALIGHLLSWPVLVLVVVLLLRSAIQNLLTREGLESLKAGPGGFEARWVTQRLEEAKHDLQAESASATPPPAGTHAAEDVNVGVDESTSFMIEMLNLAKVSPRSVVLESFARLEQVFREAMDAEPGRPGPRNPSVRTLANNALDEGLLTRKEFAALLELNNLRNVTAHDPRFKLDADQALKFAELARQVALALRTARGQTYDATGDPL
jgi:hypothetical protein